VNIDDTQNEIQVGKITRVKKEETTLVSSFKLSFVRIGVALTILRIAFKFDPNPIKAFGLLRSLIRERLAIHENSGQFKAVKSGNRYYWSVNIPGWPSETFNHFIHNEFQRVIHPEQSNLQTIVFAITNICPLHCVHCYESENISSKNSLSDEDLLLIMDKIQANGIRHIHFSGGEPLNRFEGMIELMKSSGGETDFWINTSGFGLSRERAQIMKKSGMVGAIISLDDWDENRHNTFRNNSKSFYWVKEAIKNCNEAGIVVCLSLCPVKEFVSEKNLDRYHQLAKTLGVGFIRIFEPRKAGRFAEKDILLDPNQIEIIHRFMISRNSDRTYINYPIIQFPGHHQRVSGCMGAGNRYIYIDSNGEFHSCPFCRNSLGNALTDSIDEGIAKARATGCHAFKQKILI
jgi:MoaA/NifB/PqqE/SkfB family radical SAM enzyme